MGVPISTLELIISGKIVDYVYGEKLKLIFGTYSQNTTDGSFYSIAERSSSSGSVAKVVA